MLTQYFPQYGYTDGNVILFYNRVGPNLSHQLILLDKLTSHLHKKKQEVKNLGLKLNRPAMMQKTTLGAVKTEPFELIDLSVNVSVHQEVVLRLRLPVRPAVCERRF
jgi:hypothetical protein